MANTLNNFKLSVIDNILESVAANNTVLYVFGSHGTPWLDDNFPPGSTDSIADAITESRQKMLFGKRITVANLARLTARHDWHSNTAFAEYSHLDTGLFEKDFFVITDENKVFKCLYNNFGAPSTIKPTLTQNTAFTTSDQYVWKYMFQVSPSDMAKFASTDFIPVTSDPSVVSSATDGLDVIKVEASGTGYVTTVSGSIQSVVNSTCVQIDNYASLDNEYYKDSSLYITSGPGFGTLRVVAKYTSNSSGNWVTTAKPVTGLVPSISHYLVSPSVSIIGDGTGAQAVAYVANNNSIANVSIITNGSGYTRATATIVANTFYGRGALVTAFVPPDGGHGANPAKELGVHELGVHVQFANNELSTIPTEVSFRRYGLLKNPKNLVGAAYLANTFNQTLQFSTTAGVTIPVGMVLTNQDGAQSTVVFSNSSLTIVQGDQAFNQSDDIIAANTFYSTGVLSIVKRNDLSVNSSDILHINNISPIARANNRTETIKLAIQLDKVV